MGYSAKEAYGAAKYYIQSQVLVCIDARPLYAWSEKAFHEDGGDIDIAIEEATEGSDTHQSSEVQQEPVESVSGPLEGPAVNPADSSGENSGEEDDGAAVDHDAAASATRQDLPGASAGGGWINKALPSMHFGMPLPILAKMPSFAGMRRSFTISGTGPSDAQEEQDQEGLGRLAALDMLNETDDETSMKRAHAENQSATSANNQPPSHAEVSMRRRFADLHLLGVGKKKQDRPSERSMISSSEKDGQEKSVRERSFFFSGKH